MDFIVWCLLELHDAAGAGRIVGGNQIDHCDESRSMQFFFYKTKSDLSEPVQSEEFVVNCDVSIWRGSAFLLSLLLYIYVCVVAFVVGMCVCVCVCVCVSENYQQNRRNGFEPKRPCCIFGFDEGGGDSVNCGAC